MKINFVFHRNQDPRAKTNRGEAENLRYLKFGVTFRHSVMICCAVSSAGADVGCWCSKIHFRAFHAPICWQVLWRFPDFLSQQDWAPVHSVQSCCQMQSAWKFAWHEAQRDFLRNPESRGAEGCYLSECDSFEVLAGFLPLFINICDVFLNRA